MVELTWEPLNSGRSRGGGRASLSGLAATASAPTNGSVAGGRPAVGTTGNGEGGIGTKGARCEVRQEESGLRGAFFRATVLSPLRHDGLVQVQYDTLYESVHKDILLTEWITPLDRNAVRPLPPPAPDGFHKTLTAGDLVEAWHESGWWPVVIKAIRVHHVEVASETFVALNRAYPMTQVRPRWQWAGVNGGGWQLLTGKKPTR